MTHKTFETVPSALVNVNVLSPRFTQLTCGFIMLAVTRVRLCSVHQRFFTGLNNLPLLQHRNMSSNAEHSKIPITLLGTMAFGGRADAELSEKMVKAFLDRGHREVDTAFMYTDGQSETIIGGMDLPKNGNYLKCILQYCDCNWDVNSH